MEGIERTMTIQSADEFVELRTSTVHAIYARAANDAAAVEVWFDIIHRYPDMRFWVAQNKTVPMEVLGELLHDEDPRVRSMVARKRKLTPDMLADLARDADQAVRLTVARHQHVSEDTLRTMLNDEWEEVRLVAHHRLDLSKTP